MRAATSAGLTGDTEKRCVPNWGKNMAASESTRAAEGPVHAGNAGTDPQRLYGVVGGGVVVAGCELLVSELAPVLALL
jgi:hypothetical protein